MASSPPNEIYDEIRRARVKATPEEIVRQRLLKKLVTTLHFPKNLIAVEKEFKHLPHFSISLQRRIDIVCFMPKSLSPLLLIECKASTLREKGMNQLIEYNFHIKAPFISIVNADQTLTALRDKEGRYEFITYIPSFKELIEKL